VCGLLCCGSKCRLLVCWGVSSIGLGCEGLVEGVIVITVIIVVSSAWQEGEGSVAGVRKTLVAMIVRGVVFAMSLSLAIFVAVVVISVALVLWG